MLKRHVHFLLIPWFFVGCSFTTQQANGMHSALNVMTDVADPAYGLAVSSCEARGQSIIDREGTTAEVDQADFERLRSICDSIFHSFETLRHLQVTARASVELAREGHEDALIQAKNIFIEIAGMWTEIKALIASAGIAHDLGHPEAVPEVENE